MSTSPLFSSICRLSSHFVESYFCSQSPLVSVDKPVIVGYINTGVVLVCCSVIMSFSRSKFLSLKISDAESRTVCAFDDSGTPHLFDASSRNKAHMETSRICFQ